MKRVISTILAVLMIISMLSTFAFAETVSGSCGDSVNWSLDTETGALTISGTGDMTNYASASESGWNTFASEIKSIRVESGVTSIGNNAFNGCSAESVTIADSVKTVGIYAFAYCTSLKEIALPDAVTVVSSYMFEGCTALEAVTLSDSLKTVGASAFFNCSSLKSIELPDSVTTIDAGAFRGCKALTSIDIPNGVTNIPMRAFYDCSKLESVYMGKNVTNVTANAFYGCSSLTDIYYNGSDSAFTQVTVGTNNTPFNNATKHYTERSGSCGSKVTFVFNTLTGVLTLSGSGATTNYEDVESIPWYSYASDIKKVVIGSGITTVGDNMFSDCVNLTSVSLPTSLKTICVNAFFNCTSLTEFNFSTAVTTLGVNAFFNCKSLKTLYVPKSLTTVGTSAFYGCSSLKEIYYQGTSSNFSNISILSNNSYFKNATRYYNYLTGTCGSNVSYKYDPKTRILTISGSGAMTYYNYTSSIPWYNVRSSIKTIIIESGVTSIGGYAFYYCSSLEKVFIPKTVTTIQSNAFYNCSNLDYVFYEGTSSQWGSISKGSYNTALSNATKYYSTPYIEETTFNEETGTLYVVGSGTLWAPGLDVAKRPLVKEIVVLPGITTIGANVFNGANFTNLEKVTLPEGLTTLGKGVFTDCRNLKTVTLPSTLTTIGDYAFYCNKALTKIDIPAKVTSIGANAFLGVVLTDINYKSSRANWEKVSIADGNTRLSFICCTDETRTVLDKSMGDAAYIFNSSLGKLFVSGTGYIKSFNVAQPMLLSSMAEKVKTMEIDDTLAGIGGFAFGNMYNLETVTGGANMRYIGGWAFKDCASLKSVEFTKAELFGGLNPGAFAYCSSLESIEFSDYASIMGGAALRDCTSLKEIIIPAKAKVIDTYFLWNCTSLEKITVLGAETIGAGAIQNCSALKELNLPETVKEIKGYAVFGCYALKTVNFGGTAEQWSDVVISTGNNPIDRATVNCK